MARRNDDDKEWGYLSARSVNPSDISYKTKINSIIVQGERNEDGVLVTTGEQEKEEQ